MAMASTARASVPRETQRVGVRSWPPTTWLLPSVGSSPRPLLVLRARARAPLVMKEIMLTPISPSFRPIQVCLFLSRTVQRTWRNPPGLFTRIRRIRPPTSFFSRPSQRFEIPVRGESHAQTTTPLANRPVFLLPRSSLCPRRTSSAGGERPGGFQR